MRLSKRDRDALDAAEVLFCSQDGRAYTTYAGAARIGASSYASVMAARLWRETKDGSDPDHPPTHGEICIEAAYRLIESSPALRREWFRKAVRR